MTENADGKKEQIAIVGGGITGLVCALILSLNNKSVYLFESSHRLGGRIRSLRLKNDNKLLEDQWNPEDLEFCAEFGPMRIELDKQLLLKALLDRLSITGNKPDATHHGADSAYLDAFPAYSSPSMAADPKYDLRPEEEDKTPLQLLRMAMLRIIVHLNVTKDSPFAQKQKKLVSEIQLASATQEPVDPVFIHWMKNELKDEDYWEIQTNGCVGGVPLYTMGFWNLLSDHLSHDAITKLRDLGTFYHLLPENPNAAEWLVWWLLGFSISSQLQGVHGGMECIIDKLVVLLKDSGVKKNQNLFTGAKVTAIKRNHSKLILNFETDIPSFKPPEFDRIILALPKCTAEKIVRQSTATFKPEKQILKLLDSAFAFPMVKLFVVVKERWWEKENRANQYATRIPTRELHYWKGRTKKSKQGLIMLYTDRPASSFWANYVGIKEHDDVAEQNKNELLDALKNRLVKKVAQYINENNVPDITPEDIVWYGIRDWGRKPYGGANHAWRPNRKYWVVMRRLAEISDKEFESPGIHLCGEAYSDYHGFMEGSLRSAVYVLHRILDTPQDHTLPWLAEENKNGAGGKSLCVDKEYLKSLRLWVKNLDAITTDTDFLGI